jgi:hypothetical protein
MDRIIFGDNQFFAVNHMSDEKSRAQALRFKNPQSIIEVLDYVYGIGIRTFMCTTHDRIADICDHIRSNPSRYDGFKIYPCMPYAHKYNNAVAELGVIGALQKVLPGNVVSSITRGGLALLRKDFTSMMKLLIDTEMKMFQGIETEVIFLQNIVVDLILGMGMTDFFVAFSDYVKERYNAEPGFITMNMPLLVRTLEGCGINNPIICSSINKIAFRMSGGKDLYEQTIRERKFRPIAMQSLAAGAIKPREAMEYVCGQKNIVSILFGASTASHIKQTKDIIDELSLSH